MTLLPHLRLVERSLNAKIFICACIDFQSGHITLFQKVNPTYSHCIESQNASSHSLRQTERARVREMEKLMATLYMKHTPTELEESLRLNMIFNLLAHLGENQNAAGFKHPR